MFPKEGMEAGMEDFCLSRNLGSQAARMAAWAEVGRTR